MYVFDSDKFWLALDYKLAWSQIHFKCHQNLNSFNLFDRCIESQTKIDHPAWSN